jgi:hypothetical protein
MKKLILLTPLLLFFCINKVVSQAVTKSLFTNNEISKHNKVTINVYYDIIEQINISSNNNISSKYFEIVNDGINISKEIGVIGGFVTRIVAVDVETKKPIIIKYNHYLNQISFQTYSEEIIEGDFIIFGKDLSYNLISNTFF